MNVQPLLNNQSIAYDSTIIAQRFTRRFFEKETITPNQPVVGRHNQNFFVRICIVAIKITAAVILQSKGL